MNLEQLNILAEKDPTLQIIIGVAAFAIWILAQLASALGKKKDKVRLPEHDQQQAPVEFPHAPQPPPRQAPSPAHRQQRPVKQRPQTSQRRRQAEEYRQLQPPPLTPPPRRAAPEPAPAAEAYQRRDQRVLAAQQASQTPTTLNFPKRDRLRSLLRPKNLRKEFLLTEILQSPIGLRPPGDR